MKPSKSRVGIVLVISAAAFAVLVWSGSDDLTQPPAGDAARSGRAALAALDSGRVPGRGSAPASQDTSLTDEGPATDNYDHNPLGDVLYRVLASDPQLKAFKYYHNRPLLDEENKARYHELLSDPEVFTGVKHDLLYPEETKAEQEGDIKRLMKIDYLREALEWKENPMRDELLSLIAEIILTDNFSPGMRMDMRISLSGNKQELYALLEEFGPEQAQAVLLAAKGTRLEALIAHFVSQREAMKRFKANDEGEVRF